MTWFTEAFDPAFMQRALLAGLITVVITSTVGTWIVLRGLAFLGDSLAHGVIPGVALALLWGFNPIVGAMVAALVMAAAVTVVSARTSVRDDTAIGLLFVGMLALGVVILSTSSAFSTSVSALLFGEILAVSRTDLAWQAAATVLLLGATVIAYRPLLALTFNRDKAATLGMRPALAHAALMAMLAVSIVASFQTIGTLLVMGLLIGPPATAGLLVHRVPLMMLVASGFGALSVVGGLLISFHHGTAGGATIAGLSVAIFFVVMIGREGLSLVRRRSGGLRAASAA